MIKERYNWFIDKCGKCKKTPALVKDFFLPTGDGGSLLVFWCAACINEATREHQRRTADQLFYRKTCAKMRDTNRGERKWLAMMRNAVKITPNEFTSLCDVSSLLAKGEDLTSWGADDPETSFYRSTLPDGQPCCFAQTKGFEFIFQ